MASMHMQDAEMSSVPSTAEPPSIFGSAAPSMYSGRGPTHSSTILNPDMSYMTRDESYHNHSQAQGLASMVDTLPSLRQNSMGSSSHNYASAAMHQHQHQQQHDQAQPTYLPPYFPVFDYGGASNIQNDNDATYSLAMHTQQSPGPSVAMGSQMTNYDFSTQSAFNGSGMERFAGVPNGQAQGQGHANMHASWMDLVQEYV